MGEKLKGYWLTRENGCGKMFTGVNPDEVLNTLRVELECNFDGSCEHESLTLEPCELTQEEIDNMPEFDGW